MDLIRISPDKEKERNILKMVSLLKERVDKEKDKEKMAALVIVDYYEMLKELITALLLIDGYKTLSHKDLIEYLREREKGFSMGEISVLDDLRVLRNRVAYEGFMIEHSYLIRNENLFKELIKRLEELVENKLKGR